MEPNTIDSTGNFNPVNQTTGAQLAGPVELIKSAWNLFKAHWKLLVTIAAIPAAFTLVGQLLFTGGVPLVVIGVVLTVVGIILSIAMQGAVIGAIKQYSVNPTTSLTVKGQFSFGFKYFWPFVFVIILQILIFGGSFILFIIPGIIVSVYATMYTMTLIVDDKRGFSAFTESFSVVKGRWWGVFGRMIVVGLVVLAAYLVVGGLLYLIGVVASVAANSPTANIVSSIFNMLMGVVIGPFTAAYMYKLYESLKATRAQGVSAVTFRKWLITFLVVGVIAIITIPVVGITLGAKYAKDLAPRLQDQIPYTDKSGLIQGNRPGGAGPGPELQ